MGLMNFTETWLNSETEICPEMGGYRLYRGDRLHRGGGGVAIYVKDEFKAQKIAEMSTDEVKMVAVYIERLNIINIVIYRPPGTKGKKFSRAFFFFSFPPPRWGGGNFSKVKEV